MEVDQRQISFTQMCEHLNNNVLKMRIIFVKKTPIMKLKETYSPYVHLNSVLVKNTFALFDSYVTNVTFLPCAFYLALDSYVI